MLRSIYESLKKFLNPEEAKLIWSYRACFMSDGQLTDSAKIILADLGKFCRANETTQVMGLDGRIDPYASAFAEGRREVFLHIQECITIDINRLLKEQEMQKVIDAQQDLID